MVVEGVPWPPTRWTQQVFWQATKHLTKMARAQSGQCHVKFGDQSQPNLCSVQLSLNMSITSRVCLLLFKPSSPQVAWVADPTTQLSNYPAVRLSNNPTTQLSSNPTTQHSNTPTLQRSDNPTIRQSDNPTTTHRQHVYTFPATVLVESEPTRTFKFFLQCVSGILHGSISPGVVQRVSCKGRFRLARVGRRVASVLYPVRPASSGVEGSQAQQRRAEWGRVASHIGGAASTVGRTLLATVGPERADDERGCRAAARGAVAGCHDWASGSVELERWKWNGGDCWMSPINFPGRTFFKW